MNDNVHSLDARRRLEAHDRMRELLRADASRLRNEAFAGFVLDADAFVRGTAQRTARAANRLAARLRQHAKQRAVEA